MYSLIKKEVVDKVLSISRIEDIVSKYVHLKRCGSDGYVGLCPFHSEKTPSFHVSISRNIYKCFGCGAGGNVVNFLMNIEKLSYPEAIKYLCREYNIIVEYEENNKHSNRSVNTTVNKSSGLVEKDLNSVKINKDNEKKEEIRNTGIEKKDELYVLDAACKFYIYCLYNTEKGKNNVLSYLYNRGLNDDIIKEMRIGYCSEDLSFVKEAIKMNIDVSTIINSGVGYYPEDIKYKNGDINVDLVKDRFYGRIIFPIFDLSNNVIGFGGRVLDSTDTRKSKYINTPNTSFYDKSRVLYGLNFSKNYILKNDYCYLVEGYMDFISMYKKGYKNVVATCGTSLTMEHIQTIKRFTNNVIVCYDGDDAGIKATERAMELLISEGMNVKVILFPEGEDADSFFNNKDKNHIKEYFINNKKSFIYYYIDKIKKEESEYKRADIIEKVTKTISLCPSKVSKILMIKELSKNLHIDESIFNKIIKNNEIISYYQKRIRMNGIKKQDTLEDKKSVDTIYLSLEREIYYIIYILIKYGRYVIYLQDVEVEYKNGHRCIEKNLPITVAEFYKYVFTESGIFDINREYFSLLKEVIDYLLDCINNEYIPCVKDYMDNIKNEKIISICHLVNEPSISLSNNWKEIAPDLVYCENMNFDINQIKRSLIQLKIKCLRMDLYLYGNNTMDNKDRMETIKSIQDEMDDLLDYQNQLFDKDK